MDAPPRFSRRPLARAPLRLALGAAVLLGGAIMLFACGDRRAEPITPLRPTAGVDTTEVAPGGETKKIVITRFYALRPETFGFHAEPFKIRAFDMDEPIWITRWESSTELPGGTRAPDDIHCHTTLSTEPIWQSDGQLFQGIYTDGFTPVFAFPEGFAVKIVAAKKLVFQPMFNNRRPDERKARMRLAIDFVKESERKTELRELKAFTLSSANPDQYFIPPREEGESFRRDERFRDALFPVSGRIHAIGGHLHPGGKTVTLTRVRDGKVLFVARMSDAEKIEDQRLGTYQSQEGFYVRRGDRLRVTTVYENPNDEPMDAMGGLFLFYDPEGKPSTDDS